MQDNTVKNEDRVVDKYIAILNAISDMEKRLGLADLVFLFLNILIIMFTINYITSILSKASLTISSYELLFILICLVIGMSVSVYWSASAIRMQLKLKLRYFQARFLERKINCPGESFFTDEENFFNPAVRYIISPDEKETLNYPVRGLMRMDGFIGSAKPRYFSWLMPLLFFLIYWLIFFWIIFKAL